MQTAFDQNKLLKFERYRDVCGVGCILCFKPYQPLNHKRGKKNKTYQPLDPMLNSKTDATPTT